MKILMKKEAKGFFVRKRVGELKEGDIAIIEHRVFEVAEVKQIKEDIRVAEVDGGAVLISKFVFVDCLQKEDPTIQIAIEAKLEVLRKHKTISKTDNGMVEHHMSNLPNAHWVNDGKPHLWHIKETLDEYEYWVDHAYSVRVLWKGNKIAGWDKEGDKTKILTSSFINGGKVIVLDRHIFNCCKYIWR